MQFWQQNDNPLRPYRPTVWAQFFHGQEGDRLKCPIYWIVSLIFYHGNRK